MKKRMSYRLGPAPYNEETDEYDPRPVNKVILIVDGANEYVQMEKTVAPSLEAFREVWPNEPVTGAPTVDEAGLLMATLTDEELASMGLQRKVEEPTVADTPFMEPVEDDDEPTEAQVFFNDEEAALIAEAKGVEVADLVAAGGSGEFGGYTADDIRALTE